MTICREELTTGPKDWWICNTQMIFSLERRTWYSNAIRVPKEQQSLNEYTRKSYTTVPHEPAPMRISLDVVG